MDYNDLLGGLSSIKHVIFSDHAQLKYPLLGTIPQNIDFLMDTKDECPHIFGIDHDDYFHRIDKVHLLDESTEIKVDNIEIIISNEKETLTNGF